MALPTVAEIDVVISQAMQGKSITFADRVWTSQNLSDLLALRSQAAQSEATAASGSGAGSSYRLASTSKGV